MVRLTARWLRMLAFTRRFVPPRGTQATFRAAVALLAIAAALPLPGFANPPPRLQSDRYDFPIAGATDPMWWESVHWDGNLAVDIQVNPLIPIGAREREAFYAAAVIAVIGGYASRLDNPRGGIAVLLHGDDGRTYYYSHLSGSTIDLPSSPPAPGEPRAPAAPSASGPATQWPMLPADQPVGRVRVERGDVLGTIGRTGIWTQYLEPHLHFAIAEGHQYGYFWVADVDPVDWIARVFGLAPGHTVRVDAHPVDHPRGLPLFGPVDIVERFSERHQTNPYSAGVVVTRGDAQVPVRSPMTGVARIHRDTVLGTRIQITNHRSHQSILISGSLTPTVAQDQVVYRDDVIGVVRGPVHYMHFDRGQVVDPLSR